ncbi:bacteriohopanetetrol glucosamine biosynthesis glycosyltransferase HpnI [Dyella sp. C9]|uniref:bacteriohopanetetrol glucosamine biosynthesis glycosyltransferase HpnI n=1 Tax=Dyella sp. C9 TaxID=2202154 RepID=UPI000DEEE237|nr:bacteriohopanetetrol glucosamine biosynthesis glycosyltransferase HpnI [Dyella sp. C9]
MPPTIVADNLLAWLGTALCIAATGYACCSLWAGIASRRRSEHPQADVNARPGRPTSVLKPLHGAEPGLYEDLRGYCEQDYPAYELLFGVRDPEDPAIAIVQRLQREFPRRLITLVIDTRVHGANLKVSNLINLVEHASHDLLVLADSDIRVPTDYLAQVTAPLAEHDTGIVTCLYHGIARGNLWSRLGCLFIDDWFAPSVRLTHAFGSSRFAFGSTIALRRETLDAIGGLEALRDTLADDFWIGELSRARGLRTVLSPLVVGTRVNEGEMHSLWTHELRWLRTIRAISPLGFAMTFVCFTWPVLLLGVALAPSTLNALLAIAGCSARILRYGVSWRDTARPSPWRDIWLTPFRDGLLLLEWAGALVRWRVHWRGQVLHARKHAPTRPP